MNAVNLIGLSSLCFSLACSASEHAMEFDVPYGNYGTFFQQNVGKQGRLSCNVKIDDHRYGEKWSPGVILAAAEDEVEDNTLFLDSAPAGEGQRSFSVRTFNAAQPVVSSNILTTADHKGAYTLRLAWHGDGSISYQVASGDVWSKEMKIEQPGFAVRHVSAHATGVEGTATCELSD
ncbi:hypothetical protein PSm6_45130 [Pseudomonas solani]|uniref:Uncharacterized protein n=1 Tax=Pseudomonas solani TaxID=2731552 RepID=A0ABN6BY63_9PSED|nr:hypothetical protein [Pseudomonas solani]BCD88106.1 hypothetical protein PSm6_45130 [Pseudomonas solani]